MLITSKDNDFIKHLKKLKDKKYREEYGEFIVEGIKMIQEAIDEKAIIKDIIVCDDCKNQEYFSKEFLYEIAKYNCIYVTEKVFLQITDVTNPQGILAVIDRKKIDSDINYDSDLFLILDNIQDPGNMGTILRTADSINLKQIIVAKGTADIYNPKVVRSTMGAIFRVKVIEIEDLTKVVKEMKKRKIKVYATDLATNSSIYDVDYKKSAIIIGNEANGVSKQLLDLADQKIKIPMIGKTESLNAAVATGVILYEYLRRKI